MSLRSIRPTDGAVLRSYDEMSTDAVHDAIEACHRAHSSWRRVGLEERARPMREAATLLRDRSRAFAHLMAEEMGKPLREGRSEAEKCAWVCEYYAENAARFLARQKVSTDASNSFVTCEPLGVVLAVMPWNFPFWQVFRFAAPALMAGNGGLLKHASSTTGCSLAIESLFAEAGFPEHLFRSLLISATGVPSALDHELVCAATLTGSAAAGRAVASRAGEQIKKTVLELGGSDAYLVLDDADPIQAADVCVRSRLINGGQSCIAAKRFLVCPSVREAFEGRVVEQMRKVRVGDPLDEETDIGPLARVELRDELHRQVQDSLAAGARCLLGARVPDGPGAYYPPTVLTDVPADSPAYRDELFGPVAAIVPVPDEGEAIRVANDTAFGLGACVFTRDLQRGERIAAEELEAGCCFVNDFVRSDPRLPFGGVKESGYGRELGSQGIREFVNIKTVWVA